MVGSLELAMQPYSKFTLEKNGDCFENGENNEKKRNLMPKHDTPQAKVYICIEYIFQFMLPVIP